MVPPKKSPRINICQPGDYLLVTNTKMQIPTEELLYNEVIEKLHVYGSKTNCRIHIGMKYSTVLQLLKGFRKLATQLMSQVFKHLAKVPVLKLQNIDVHQQPKIVMVVDHLLDETSKPLQIVCT